MPGERDRAVGEGYYLVSNVTWAEKTKLARQLRRRVLRADTVLDIGTGILPQTLVWAKLHICVEPHSEYVECLRQGIGSSPRYLIVQSQWRPFMNTLSPKSVDTVIALDFIEHLAKEEGFAFLGEAERVARRQVIIFTPLGYFPQCYDNSGEKDRWGMSGGEWQTHRSGWVPTDFSTEWEIVACRHYHDADQHGQVLEEPHGCFWAIKTFSQRPHDMDPIARHTVRATTEPRLWGLTIMRRYAPLWLERLLVVGWQYKKKWT